METDSYVAPLISEIGCLSELTLDICKSPAPGTDGWAYNDQSEDVANCS